MILVPYSQHFIFFVTYGWAKCARVYITLGSKSLPGNHYTECFYGVSYVMYLSVILSVIIISVIR